MCGLQNPRTPFFFSGQRAAHPAFHPHGQQQVIFENEALFVLFRRSPDGRKQVLCLHNVSDREQSCHLGDDLSEPLIDLVSGERYNATDEQVLQLGPYLAGSKTVGVLCE